MDNPDVFRTSIEIHGKDIFEYLRELYSDNDSVLGNVCKWVKIRSDLIRVQREAVHIDVCESLQKSSGGLPRSIRV